MKLLADIPADGPGVRAHRAEGEPRAGEDARVGIEHGAIAGRERGRIEVEGVSVLHEELARAHDTKARPHLVTELGLDLVEVYRQLAVALKLAPGDIGDHFLVRGPGHEVTLVPILDAQQLRPVLAPASRFLPQLRGLHHRHHQFQGAGAVHLLADDVLHLFQDSQAHGQPAVQPRRQAPDEPRAQHELMAHDLRLGGGFLHGVDRILGKPHRRALCFLHPEGSWHLNRSPLIRLPP